MAYQHFLLDPAKPHARKVALLIKTCQEVIFEATNLKNTADEVTAGGAETGSEGFQTLFGLPSSNAGAALYPLLQSIMGGTLTPSLLVEFDQGI